MRFSNARSDKISTHPYQHCAWLSGFLWAASDLFCGLVVQFIALGFVLSVSASALGTSFSSDLQGKVVDKLGVAPGFPVEVRVTTLGGVVAGSAGIQHDGSFSVDGIRPGDYIIDILVNGKSVRRVRFTEDGLSSRLPVIHLDSRNPTNPAFISTVDWHALTVPRKAKHAFSQGVKELKKQHLRAGLRCFQRAIDDYPQYCAAYQQLAVSYFDLGEDDSALSTLQGVDPICEQDAHLLALHGKILLRMGQVEPAIDVLLRAIGLDDKVWNAQKDLADALIRVGRYEEAYEHATNAHRVRPAKASSHIVFYQALAHLEKFELALEELDEITTRFPSSPESSQAQLERGRLAMFLKNRQRKNAEKLPAP